MIRPMAATAGFALAATLATADLATAMPAPVQAVSAGARYVSLPVEISPVLAQAPRPAQAPVAAREAPETTASLKPAPEKPWCPAGRLVGTGVGFCLIN